MCWSIAELARGRADARQGLALECSLGGGSACHGLNVLRPMSTWADGILEWFPVVRVPAAAAGLCDSPLDAAAEEGPSAQEPHEEMPVWFFVLS